MIYVDEYESKAITDSPPKSASAQSASVPGLKPQAFQYFWFLTGVTIAENFTATKQLLAKYGVDAKTPEEAINAMVEFWGTEKWVPFLKEYSPFIERSVAGKFPDLVSQESGFIIPLIAAIGAVGSGILGLSASSKGLKAAKEQAKATTMAGVAAVLAEKEKQKAAQQEAVLKERRIILIVIISLVLIAAVIIGLVIYKRSSKK